MVGRSESVHTQMHANSPYFGSSGNYRPAWFETLVFVNSLDRPKSDGMTFCNWWREEDQIPEHDERGLDVDHT